ncbi:MAG: hypothetical protein FJY75_06645 [Candidatus Eisenbacteria bacterium]|uniref:Esterase-like activity of phytase family protein n=1 Tax=Eiseniibacteriota bacterium TaxID=2212470 RepID=A0A937XBQ0_UNCEI|nr:hypothetical protein [Candidatus Eisenbacteria bacterium]
MKWSSGEGAGPGASRANGPAPSPAALLVAALLAGSVGLLAAPGAGGGAPIPGGTLPAGQGPAGPALEQVALIAHPRIGECSGIVRLDGAFFAHNDSGDEPVLYRSPTLDFAEAEVLPLPGAEAIDWEDIALLDGDLLIGDIGDNRRRRDRLVLYRARYIPAAEEEAGRLELVAALPFRYPDGRHNAEALAVVEGRVHIVTKAREGEPTWVYRFEELLADSALAAGEWNVPHRAARLELGVGGPATAADYDDSSGALVLLTGRSIAFYDGPRIAGAPVAQLPIRAGQCEALCVRGADLIVANEGRQVFILERFVERILDPARRR